LHIGYCGLKARLERRQGHIDDRAVDERQA
jgi:hypothetical protein